MEYSIAAPSIFVKHYMDEDDITSGIVPQRIVSFWEKWVLAKLIGGGEVNRLTIIKFISETPIPELESLPSDKYVAPCLSTFRVRLLALLWILGTCPS